MKRKIRLSIIGSVVASLFVSSTTLAGTLGYITIWNADVGSIGRFSSTPSVWYGTVGTSNITSSALGTYISHARNQWSQIGISTTSSSTQSGTTIQVYGGTYSTLKQYEPSLSSTHSGLTISSTTTEGEWFYNGIPKTGLKMGRANVYIIDTGATTDQYKKTTTHEVGHALGWIGHSSVSTDVMYGSRTSVTTLTTRDKQHLDQVYP